jgi:glutathione S-transferase
MSLIIHGAAPSPFARKVRVLCHEKGLDYELRTLAPFPKTPELLALHPLGKIPVLQDGDFVLPDSSVICAYLERLHPAPRLYPKDPKQLGRALWYEEYADTKLIEVVGAVFFERFVKPNVFNGEPDEAVVRDALENKIPPAFDYLEKQIPKGGETLLGELSIADLAVGAQLQGLALANETIDAGRWPELARYATALLARPSFEKAMS